MVSISEDQIYDLIALDKFKRAAMSRYFGRLSEDERIEAVRFAYDLAKQNMQKSNESMKGKPDFFYSMLCLAIWKMNWTREALSKKNPNLTLEQSKEIGERRIASLLSTRKDRTKRGKLSALIEIRLFHVVEKLRSEGISWRESAIYLKRYHHAQISHVQLRKLFNKIKEEKKMRGDE